MQAKVLIRQETIQDKKKTFELIKETFKHAEHTDGDEHNLVERLRESSCFIPELSLVAELGNEIIGHILFTQVKVGNTTQLALAPLTVAVKYQRQGIGGLLIQHGHKIAKSLGYEYSILLGYPSYYSRFGYVPAKIFGIKSPFDVPDEFFMAINLQGKSTKLNAIVEYPKEFQ